MAKGVILTDDDFDPPPAKATAPAAATAGRLIIEGDEGFDVPAKAAPQAPPAEPPADDRGLLARGWDALKGANQQVANFTDAAARNLGQAASFGLVDEGASALDAAVKTATGDGSKGFGDHFRDSKAQYDAMDQTSADRSPAGAAVGTVTGLALPAGAAKTVVGGVLKTVGRGALAGAGASDGDVTTAGGLVERAKDAAIGAGAGTAVAGVAKGAGAVGRKMFSKAGERVETRAVDKLLEGTPAKTVQDPSLAKLGGKAGFVKTVKEEGLEKAFKGRPADLEEQVGAKLDSVGKKLGKYYEGADAAAPAGIPLDKVKAGLEKAKQQYVAASNGAAVDAIDRQIANLDRFHGQKGAIGARDLHKYISETLSPKAFSDTGVAKASEAAKLARAMRSEAVDVLQQHVDDVAKAYPPLGSRADLRALNEKYGKLRAIEEVAHAKAERMELYSPTLGQRMIQGVKMGTDAGAAATAAGALMSGNPTIAGAAALVPIATRALPAAAGGADKVAVFAQQLLAKSPNAEEFMRRAALAGIPREVAQAAVQSQQP